MVKKQLAFLIPNQTPRRKYNFTLTSLKKTTMKPALFTLHPTCHTRQVG